MPIGLQILSQVELVEETSVELVEEVITQPIGKDEENLKPWINILSTNVVFEGDNVTHI